MASLLAVFFIGAASATVRVVSLNLCTDSMLFELADHQQIASVSYLSRDSNLSPHARRAAALPVNYGGIEEILLSRPDLVITGSNTSLYSAALARDRGLQVAIFDPASTLEGYWKNLQRLADLLGHRERASNLIKAMQTRLQALPEPDTNHPRHVLIYLPNGYSPGRGTLPDDLIRLSHGHNAAETSFPGQHTISLEALLITQTLDLIVFASHQSPTASLARQHLEHPAFGAMPRVKRLEVLQQTMTCGGAVNLIAIEAINAALRQ
ncbi:MAG: ABC transporter substrate-binding protein [Pseudomonadota bacterium]